MKNKHKLLYCVIAVILLINCIAIIINIPRHTFRIVSYGSGITCTTDVIDTEKVYKQTFCENNKIHGIRILLGTCLSTLSEEYVVEIGNNKSGEILFNTTIHGKDVVDNEYYVIDFPYALEGKTEYYFSVYAADKSKDTLVLWASEKSSNNVNLYKNGELTDKEICFNIIVEKNNKSIIAALVFACFFVIIVLSLYKFKYSKYIIYAFGLFIIVTRMLVNYNEQNLALYDEMAHISYLTYVSQSSEVVPRFEDMHLLIPEAIEVQGNNQTLMLCQKNGVFRGKQSNTVCYLGHAPLYYWILNAFKCVTTDSAGIVSVNLDKLRILNAGIVLLAVFIMFYIGFTRIDDKPLNHLLYAIIISTLPMFSYLGVTVNNDNLTILSVALTFLGAIRISEKKYDIKTYLLVALGVCMTLMCKLTAGMIIVIAALIIIFVTIIRDKSFDILLNKYFLYTIPIYLLVIAYYLVIYGRYGAFQPSLTRLISEEEFMNYGLLYQKTENFVADSRMQYLKFFENMFIIQWSDGVYGNSSYILKSITHWVYRVFWVIIGCQSVKVLSSKKENYLMGAFSISIVITIISEYFVAYKSYLYSGHGATQSRYYVCVLVVMAMIFVNFIQGLRKRIAKTEDDSELTIDYVDCLCMVIVYVFLYYGLVMYYTR